VRRWLGREKEVEGCVNKRRGSARSPSARRWGVEVLVAYFAVRPLASRDFAGAHHCLRPPWAQAVVGGSCATSDLTKTVGTGII
jgi:hypothetical protein